MTQKNSLVDKKPASKKTRELRQYFLEDKLLSTKNGAEVNAAKWALACACPDDWRERKEVEVTVNGLISGDLGNVSGDFVIDG